MSNIFRWSARRSFPHSFDHSRGGRIGELRTFSAIYAASEFVGKVVVLERYVTSIGYLIRYGRFGSKASLRAFQYLLADISNDEMTIFRN